MAQFLQLLINALAIGSIYAVTAMSFEIAYEATGVVNFATGQLVTVGALVGASALAYTHGGFTVSYVATLAIMAAVGLAFFITVFQPLRGKPAVTVVIGTVGIGISIQNMSQLIWGPAAGRGRLPRGSLMSWPLFGTVIPLHAMFIIVVAAVLIICVYLLLNRSAIGRQFRALAQDAEAARLMGIRVGWVYCFTWVLVAALAGVAGVLLSPPLVRRRQYGRQPGAEGLCRGGDWRLRQHPRAVCGGILVGAAEILAQATSPPPIRTRWSSP